MKMKKWFALLLSIVVVLSFVGCGNKEETKTEQSNNEVVSQETDNNSIIGTWVVTKTEAYDGPLKSMVEQITDTYFYIGAEYEFYADGIVKGADGKYTNRYTILNDNQIMMADVSNGSENIYDYELNGDEYVQYGLYLKDNVPIGRSNAIYFKRK